MPEITWGGAALAGLLSFLSPCILPMVPFYLSYMAGSSVAELRGEGANLNPKLRARLIGRALCFALGVTTIFLLLGLSATALGQAFSAWKEVLSWGAGLILIAFGLHFLGILQISLFYREARSESRINPAGAWGAYLMGLAFGFGWTPCVGPALAAILMVAGDSAELWRGGALLVVYGLAMTLPFVLAAAFAGPVLRFLARHRRLSDYARIAMGIMLMLFGGLILTGSVPLIADWMIRNFDWSGTVR